MIRRYVVELQVLRGDAVKEVPGDPESVGIPGEGAADSCVAGEAAVAAGSLKLAGVDMAFRRLL